MGHLYSFIYPDLWILAQDLYRAHQFCPFSAGFLVHQWIQFLLALSPVALWSYHTLPVFLMDLFFLLAFYCHCFPLSSHFFLFFSRFFSFPLLPAQYLSAWP